MKGGFLTLLLAVVLGWTSCSDEEVIPDVVGGKDIVLSTSFGVGDLNTKAITGSEKTIKNRFIAAFRVVDGKYACTGISRSEDGISAMKIKAKTGHMVFVAVANANELSTIIQKCDPAKESTYPLYEDLRKDVISVASFDPSSLVKVKEEVWMNTILADSTKELKFELEQLAARVDMRFEVENQEGSFLLTSYEVRSINGKSFLFDAETKNGAGDGKHLLSKNTGYNWSTQGFQNSDINKGFSFYTFAKTNDSPITMILKGELKDSKNKITSKVYSFTLAPEKGGTSQTTGIYPNYVYTVTGMVSMKTQGVEFETTVDPWTEKNTDVSIIDFKYLYVKDQDITMVNVGTFTTTFESSSEITIESVMVTPKDNTGQGWNDTSVEIKRDEGKKGMITIKSEVPNNFAPREISFTVKNEDVDVTPITIKVIQYPPLYIDAGRTKEVWYDKDGQNNTSMYIFTTLVPDYANIPNIADLHNAKRGNEWQSNFPSSDAHTNNVNMFQNAVMGFPITDAKGRTVNTPENNKLISPKFILASQYGITNPGTYQQAWTLGKTQTSDPSCEKYVEHGRILYPGAKDSTDVTFSDWRLPTQAELCMIDVLQTTSRCAVTKILEGFYYWSAFFGEKQNIGGQNLYIGAFRFMNPWLSDGGDYYKASWRCVHDLKEVKQ